MVARSPSSPLAPCGWRMPTGAERSVSSRRTAEIRRGPPTRAVSSSRSDTGTAASGGDPSRCRLWMRKAALSARSPTEILCSTILRGAETRRLHDRSKLALASGAARPATIRGRVRGQTETGGARTRGAWLSSLATPARARADSGRALRQGSFARDRRSRARAQDGDDRALGIARDPRRRRRGSGDSAPVDPRGVRAGSDPRHDLAHRSARGPHGPANPRNGDRAPRRRVGRREDRRRALARGSRAPGRGASCGCSRARRRRHHAPRGRRRPSTCTMSPRSTTSRSSTTRTRR